MLLTPAAKHNLLINLSHAE